MRTQKLRSLLLKYKHAWILSYFIIYMIWFVYLERRQNVNYYSIHMKIDDYIPFCEYFIVPYLLWFAYIAATMIYFFFTSVSDFYKYCALLFTGMTICLILYTFLPSAQELRPVQFENDTIFTQLVAFIYKTDTPTNVCPSIHVLNSVGAFLAVYKCDRLRKHKWIIASSGILSVSICMSTVFLKQHSFMDVLCGLALALILYGLIYNSDYKKLFNTLTLASQRWGEAPQRNARTGKNKSRNEIS